MTYVHQHLGSLGDIIKVNKGHTMLSGCSKTCLLLLSCCFRSFTHLNFRVELGFLSLVSEIYLLVFYKAIHKASTFTDYNFTCSLTFYRLSQTKIIES